MRGSRLAATMLFVVAAGVSPAAADSLVDHVRDTLHEAGNALGAAATAAGGTVSAFLATNPDLARDLADFAREAGFGDGRGASALGAGVAIWPASGQPGGLVVLRASGLPGSAPVTIAVAPPHSPTQEIGNATASTTGSVEMTVFVPDWALGTESVLFVVETADGRVRLTSNPFIVLPPLGIPSDRVIVLGTLSREGKHCPAMRGDDGRLYTLIADDSGFTPGDRVRVEGALVDGNLPAPDGKKSCAQGQTIRVLSMTAPG